MKLYLEALEVRPPYDPLVSERVRVDVSENTDVERAAILAALKDLMSGLNCIYTRHECYHAESKPCKVEAI